MAVAEKKRVCIVGAGAAGSAAAYALSRHPDKFEVVVIDKEKTPGGMATSLDIDKTKYGASYVNDGVQGCSPQFANTIRMFKELSYNCTEVQMQISFGKGDDFWTNVFPSSLTRQFEKEIKKFGRVLKIIKTFEVVFAFIPVRVMLRIFRLSQEFGEKMVYPLVALFFGVVAFNCTGNQTPYVSSAILERVFLDPSMKLFEYNDTSLLASIPTMYSFPKLQDVYTAWQDKICSNGNVHYKLGHEVTCILQRESQPKGGVAIEFKSPEGDSLSSATFDELIMACDADTALKLLGKEATWRERRVLGNVKYLNDVTITHSDMQYMMKHYETKYDQSFNAPPKGTEDEEAFKFAESNFRPLYYTLQYPQDRSKIEMSFDLTHYQGQFRGAPPEGPSSESDATNNSGAESEPRLENHVFQTIFLDRDSTESLWTWNEINSEHKIYEKWWKQQSHRWQHYVKVVPWMMFINGRHHTNYAGAWTVLNMHELAITSGFAAAYRLGAAYPFTGDQDCQRLFVLYLALSHGARMRKEDRSGVLQ